MSFFVHFHRSVVDRQFYGELVRDGRARPLQHLMLLVLFSTLLSCSSETIRALNPRTGLGPLLELMMKGIRIHDGVMHPPRSDPYVLDPAAVARIWTILGGVSVTESAIHDSVLMVDTGEVIPLPSDGTVRVYLRKKTVEVNVGSRRMVSVRYADLFPEGTFSFTEEDVRILKQRFIPSVVVFFLFRDIISISTTVIFVVVLFSTSTYFFRKPRIMSLRGHIETACFSVGPLIAGMTVMAMANSRQTIVWYVFFAIALIVHIRGVDAASESLLSPRT